MSGGPDVASLVPHAGSMCLLERIESWDEEHVVASSSSHRTGNHPLATRDGLRAVHLCEYGAQAMAAHGSLLARARLERAEPGLLVSLRDVRLLVDYVPRSAPQLLVTARRLQATAAAWQYAFRVECDAGLLAEGRATVALLLPR